MEDSIPKRNSGQTRSNILLAARKRFSLESYDNVGTRNIAADAGVDAALVNRYFGSKEKLFAEAIAGQFRIEDHLPENMSDLGIYLASHILDDTNKDEGFDALRVLLRAAANPLIAKIVSERFHAEFVSPLATLLKGNDTEIRASLIASYVIGLATMCHALGSDVLFKGNRSKAIQTVAAAIQACVE